MRAAGAALGAVVVLCAVEAFPAGAQGIPSSNGVFTGCYLRGIGTLRIINPATERCLPRVELQVTWGQTGPQGPQGPKGDAGPAGPPGRRMVRMVIDRDGNPIGELIDVVLTGGPRSPYDRSFQAEPLFFWWTNGRFYGAYADGRYLRVWDGGIYFATSDCRYEDNFGTKMALIPGTIFDFEDTSVAVLASVGGMLYRITPQWVHNGGYHYQSVFWLTDSGECIPLEQPMSLYSVLLDDPDFDGSLWTGSGFRGPLTIQEVRQ